MTPAHLPSMKHTSDRSSTIAAAVLDSATRINRKRNSGAASKSSSPANQITSAPSTRRRDHPKGSGHDPRARTPSPEMLDTSHLLTGASAGSSTSHRSRPGMSTTGNHNQTLAFGTRFSPVPRSTSAQYWSSVSSVTQELQQS